MSNSTVTTCSGNFYDTGGSGSNYSANENLTMTFNPGTPGQYIQINFISFNTNANNDYLYVYDGSNTSAPLMGIYCGANTPGSIGARSSSGSLTFKFTSNNSGQQAGWQATISCSATRVSTGNFLMTNGAVDTLCTANFYDSGGSGSNYSANENKVMTFYPATSGNYVQAIFSVFSTANNNDFLYIYDGPNTSSPLIARYTGTTAPDTIVARNSSGCLTFEFTSNASGQTTGWAASLSCSATRGSNSGTYPITNNAVDTICGGRFYDSGGNSNNYNANESSTMTFYPSTAGHYISVTFTSFNTQANTDYLYIYDGPSAASPLIAIYSGLTSPGTIGARNSAGCLTFVFTSNASTQNLGWAATLSCNLSAGSTSGVYPMTNSAVDTVCGGTFYDQNGASNYSNNENKTMTFYPASAGQYLKVSFSAFATQSFNDLLYIYDGPSTSSTLIGIWSGSTSPNNIAARNAAGCLTFVFTSNSSGVAAGWIATFSCSVTPGTTDGVYLCSNNAVITACGGTFYDDGGSGNYNINNIDTTTLYPATAGQYVSLTFSSFTTQTNNDFMYIFDGPNASSPLIAVYQDQSSPGTITARNSSGCLTIVFTSGGSSVFSGWQASISCSATPGSALTNYPISNNAVDTVCSGTFYDSGGSPSQYSNSETKTMTFYPATAGYYLSVNFTSVNTEAQTDFLYIYDGTSASAPLIGIYSGTSTPCTMTASNISGALTFVFTSNGGTTAAGWSASFNCVASSCSNSGCFPISNNAVGKTCNGNFYDSGGSGGNYNSNENFTMTFYPTSGQFVQFVFSAFQTQAGNDILYIYDGTNTSATLIGSYSGNTNPGTITATNIAGALTVKFVSNATNNQSGWAATVQCTGTGGTTVWTGAVSNSWTQINNWSNPCLSPSCAVDVSVPSTATGPRISANTNVRNITIASGATLTVDPGVTLTVCGDFTNNGTLSISPTSTLLFNNAAVVQNLSGSLVNSNRIGNLTITKTGGSLALASNLDIGGNFLTSNSTSIFNTGGKYLKLMGDFTNSSGATTFTNVSGGTLEFTGTNSQTYSPGGVLALNNVTMNKASNELTVSGNNLIIGPAGVLTLTSGKIISNALEVIIQNTSGSSITGSNTMSYIEGNLRRYITGAAGSWAFPVGHATKGYQNATVSFTTPTLITDIGASFTNWSSIPTGPVSNDCISNSDYSRLPALDNGYWTLTPSANSNSGTYDITLNGANYSNQGPAAYWTVMRAASSAGPWSLPGSCVAASTVSNASRTGLSGFGVFTTGQSPNLLPVTLISFTGRNENEKNVLEWKTAAEINNSYFTVQRSADGINFSDLEVINGAGNSSTIHSYRSFDYDPYQETYYRIAQSDFDGRVTYSEIISIDLSIENRLAQCSPNPSDGRMKVKFFGKPGENIDIKIADIFGQVIYEFKDKLQESVFVHEIDIKDAPTGIYYLNIESAKSEVFNRKLVIQK